MAGKKRSHGSRSNSRSVSPDFVRRKLIKSSVEQNESTVNMKHKQSTSSDRSQSTKVKKSKKTKKRRHRSSSSSSESSTDSDSNLSTSHPSVSSSSVPKMKKKKKHKKSDKKKHRKKKKLKKRHKKEKRKLKKAAEEVTKTSTNAGKVDDTEELDVNKSSKLDEAPDQLLLDRAKAMAPMTKEEWEKRQSVIRKVYDEETGRHRLIKGDGEVLEEIVSRDRHREINRRATQGDGAFFQATIASKLRK